ncbi:MAG: hypothetical protein JWO57_3891 [Pseudonocardiales bacterium]|nr:hypothetical protein [Pseudonocardiales bacterium]
MPTSTFESGPGSTPRAGRRLSSRSGRAIGGTLVVGLTVAAVTVAGAPGAVAATPPLAQSVGRFLDGAVGGNPIQQLADLKDARATAPGSTSTQNPLDATLLGSLNAPLTGALQLPQVGGITLGAANQVAVARSDGYSYAGSGAVLNSGGASVGGNNSAFPADTTFDLSAGSLASGLPVPGVGPAATLGGVTLTVGAVSALAQTPTGVGKAGSTKYGIAGLRLGLESPALGQLLSTLSTALNPSGVLGTITGLLNGVLPAGCNLSQVLLPSSLSLGNGIVISATNGGISIDLAAFLKQLNLGDLSSLPPNTDLIDHLLTYLTSVGGLTTGIENVINGLTDSLQAQFAACAAAVPTLPAVLAALTSGRTTLENAINGLVGSLGGVGGTGNPLAPIGAVLKKLVDIGANVQPNGPAGTFTSQLKATPDQATPVVAGQTIVRAVEINLVGDPLATIALANAAAGPSTAAVAPTSSASPTPPATALPIGVPAGAAQPAGSPDLPLVLLAVGLLMGAAGAVAWKVRGRPGA